MASVLFDDHSDIHYPKLDPKSAQIRLIVLAPGALDCPIHCTYRVVNLDDDNLSYETLSYVWQDGTGTGPILVDGNAATVTRSLFGALEQLRFVDKERILWVDAICINQSDDDEKTHQMGQLGEISVQDANLAIGTLAWMAGDIADPPASLNNRSERRRVAEALNAFATKPWWGRIWTVQEAILPSQRSIYWGPCSLPWRRLHRACEAFMDGGATRRPAGEFFGAFNNLTAGVRGLRFSTNEHPLHLLWRWRFRQASEPRDKVYALLGMRPDSQLPSVPSCDYNDKRVDARTLFIRVAADLINICRDLNPLIGRRGEAPAVPGLPSWVVDWSGPLPGQGRSEFWVHEARWMRRGYCADQGIYGVGDGLQFADEKETLLLSGLYVDTIAVVEQRQMGSHGNGGTAFHEVLLDGADRWADLIKRFQRSGTAATGQAVELPDGWMQAFLGLIMGRLVPVDPNDGDPDDWAREMLKDQAIFITQGGRFGLGPLDARPGQQLWIVGGSRFPVILDMWSDGIAGKIEDEVNCRDFTWVSDCFVYGMMKGEVVEGRGHEQVRINLH